MRYFNICAKRTITTPNGDKQIYRKIGVIKTNSPESDGLWYVQLYQYPDFDYHVFPSQGEELPVIE